MYFHKAREQRPLTFFLSYRAYSFIEQQSYTYLHVFNFKYMNLLMIDKNKHIHKTLKTRYLRSVSYIHGSLLQHDELCNTLLAFYVENISGSLNYSFSAAAVQKKPEKQA